MIFFSQSPVDYDLVETNGCKLDTVQTFKLLGLHIQDNLKRNSHVAETVKKAAKRLYFLVQVKRAHVVPSKLVHFYIALYPVSVAVRLSRFSL